MKNQSENKVASNRRSGNERRVHETDLGFPFVDGHGLLVTEERRQIADRRIGYSNLRTDSLDQLAIGKQTA
jgi:hypothetical protein